LNLRTERWFQLPPKALNDPVQTSLFHTCNVPYRVAAAGRRSYKTERMKRLFVNMAGLDPEIKNHRFFLGAPTRPQAKKVFWEDLKALTPKWTLRGRGKESIRESELTILYRQGNEIVIVGLEEYERIEGVLWHGAGITEFQKVDPLFYPKTLQPIMNDTMKKSGGGIWIMEGRPLGKNHFFDLFCREKTEPERWKSFHWTSEEILDADQIHAAKADIGEMDYRREYLADFETSGQRVYYAYSEYNHKKLGVDYIIDWSAPLNITCDFNATEKPMTWSVGQSQGHFEYWFKTLSFPFTNTATMCVVLDDYFKELKTTYGHYPRYANFYGDYSGLKRTSNSSFSDWDIIDNFKWSEPLYTERLLKQTETVRDRAAASNALLCNANNERRMFVDPQGCKALIRDWDRVGWKDNGVDLDDGKDPTVTHASDGIDYFSDYKYPIKQESWGGQV